MTIREMENATGLTRANIRFYEKEGLIATERAENNYREYTPEHAQILLRVKLLRALGMSLEQIKALQSGQEELLTALDRQIRVLEQQREQLGNSRRVCSQMRSDNVRYETLDAQRYLSSLENPPQKPSVIIARDVEPRIFAPWQRFWARSLDAYVYGTLLVTAATLLAGGKSPQWGTVVSTLLGFVLMLILEPVQLRLFGTTLGKWIFGIRVTDADGRRLSLSEGFWRTAVVLWYGQGLNVPFVELWRLYKSYKTYENNEFLPWDDPSELTVKDKKPWRYLAAAATAAAVFGLSFVVLMMGMVPEHQGELTVAAFCENYQKMENIYGMDDERYTLWEDGTWLETPQPNTAYIDMSANSAPLDFVFTTENGHITSVTISEEVKGEQDGWIGGHTSQRQLMSLAMLTAQEEYSAFSRDEEIVLTAIAENPFGDFTVSCCGLVFDCRTEYSGCWPSSAGGLIEDDDPDTETCYSMTYTISLSRETP